LEDEGYKVMTAQDGANALAKLMQASRAHRGCAWPMSVVKRTDAMPADV